mmetsp:Transcript_47889/g.113806  ORF Transcript_47889/g.113806 Transcript_47889/m.113806 type:complete len:82 (-) Transcript_47889:235-480(-)
MFEILMCSTMQECMNHTMDTKMRDLPAPVKTASLAGEYADRGTHTSSSSIFSSSKKLLKHYEHNQGSGINSFLKSSNVSHL